MASRWDGLVSEFIQRRTRIGGDTVAVNLSGERLTVARWHDEARSLADTLDRLPLPSGVVVARIPNSIAAASVVAGALHSRHALLMVHPQLPAAAANEALGRLGPIAEVTLDGDRPSVIAEPYGSPRPLWMPPAARPDLGVALCVMTSGTTGRPRVIGAPHRQVRSVAGLIAARLNYRPSDVVAVVSPLSFDYGLYQLLLSFSAGATLILDPRLGSVTNLAVAVGRCGATVLPLVPSMLRTFANSPLADRVDTSGVRLVTTTGDLLTEADIEAARAAFRNADVRPMYGLSECKRVAIAPPGDVRPAGAIGLPLEGTDAAIVDPSGARAAVGSAGELVVAGPHLTLGYLNDAESTARRMTVDRRSGTRLLRTGDRLRVDDAGWLFWVGRATDVIKTSGYRVHPAEIETAAARSGLVVECIAYGRPDLDRGQVPVLRARLADGIDHDRGRAGVAEALESRLPLWARPDIDIVDEPLPKTANGKLDRAAFTAGEASGTNDGDVRDGPAWPPMDLARSTFTINCHTQALLCAYPPPPGVSVALFEVATTVPFGVRAHPEDPHRMLAPWLDPDLGLDLAAKNLGLRVQTCWHETGDEAFARLDSWLRTTPVLLGPLDLGDLTYHEFASTLAGCDHYIVVLGRTANGRVIVIDPEGYVRIEIDETALRRAWAAGAVPEGRGPFTMRRIAPGKPAPAAETISGIATAAAANLQAAAAADHGGAHAYRRLAAINPDPRQRRALSILLPAAAGRQRLCAGFADLAANANPRDASQWRRAGELWREQTRTLALAHATVLRLGTPSDLFATAAATEDRLLETFTHILRSH